VYEEKPMAVIDCKEQVTRNCVVKLYKVLWSNHGEADVVDTIFGMCQNNPSRLISRRKVIVLY
jgi:hypothetical protein